MSEDPTRHLFEDKVLARLDAIDARLTVLEKKSSERDYETRPIWERVLNEITQINTSLANLDRKLDVMNKELLQLKADNAGLTDRMNKLESQTYPNVIAQERQF
jgi:predicted  nucleic acid-binding Zn-ribbon protein